MHSIELIISELQGKGWKFIESGPLYYKVDYQGKYDVFTVNVDSTSIHDSVIYVFAASPFNIDIEKKDSFLTLLNTINQELNYGSFSLDLNDGEFYFVIGLFYTSSILNLETVEYMLHTTCLSMDKYTPVFDGWNDGLSVKEALAMVK